MTQKIPSLIFRSRRLLIILFSLHLLAFSGLAQSASVFFQAPAAGGDGVDAFTPEEYADDFSLASNAKITGIQWWGSFIDSATTSSADNIFDIHFYNDGGGIPAASSFQSFLNVTAIRNTTSLLDIADEPVFRFDALSLSPLSLLANETYYVSINHVDLNDEYFWLQSDSPGSYFNQNTTANISWAVIAGNNLAFNLIPEPTIPMLFSMALLFSGFRRRLAKI